MADVRAGQGAAVDTDRARQLLAAERTRVAELLAETSGVEQADVAAVAAEDSRGGPGDMFDPAQALDRESVDRAVVASLEERLAAIGRAEERLAAGTYGVSVRSGDPIPDARLEHDPAAELTVEEASDDEAHRADPPDGRAP